jgi:hypothetical protein
MLETFQEHKSFTSVTYVGVYKFSIVYIDIGGEHKAHVIKSIVKIPILKRLKFFN